MTIGRVLLFLIGLLLVSCTAPSPQLAALESGFGGTGLLPCPQAHAYTPGDSGFGGTGHSDPCGFGGTGVIGTITDFGSIWVNGLEIELTPDTRIDSNLGHPVQLAIGQLVITHTAPDALETDHIQVFYPIAGRIEQQTDNLIQVAGEIIHLNQATRGLKQVQTGDYVAVNGWPRADGSWLATRIDPNPQQIEKVDRPTLDALRTRKVLVEGTVVHQDGKSLLAPYNLPLTAEEARQIENGTLALVIAQRIHQRWQIEHIQALRQWHMDWQQIHLHQRHMQEVLQAQHKHLEHIEQIHEQHEAEQMLNEHRNESHEVRAQLESIKALKEQQMSLREQREQAEDMREYRDHFENFSIQREMLEDARKNRYHNDN